MKPNDFNPAWPGIHLITGSSVSFQILLIHVAVIIDYGAEHFTI